MTVSCADGMSEAEMSPAIERTVRKVDGHEILDALTTKIRGSEFATLMLEIVRRRAGVLASSNVLRQYQDDRFTRPSRLDSVVCTRCS